MKLLDGKEVSARIKEDIKRDAAEFTAKSGRKPHLVAILVGNDGGSETYVASKMRNCELVGFDSTNIRYDESITEAQLIAKIQEINADDSIDGLIVQLPLPKHIDPERITEAIDYRKDVDGFHPINLGRMQRNLPCFIPATPYGILLMLEYYGIDTSGLHAVVVGRSNIVGSPMSILLARNSNPGNCTVTLTHSRTKDLKAEVLRADIVVAAIGKKNFVTADMVKEGAIVIDVGINREESTATKSGYKLYGDVDFEEVSKKASWITPVPGGVGLMTIVGLLKNTLEAAKGTIYA
ncbi:bifunctional 5,10-methylenetetrahydrofolate dehydrogenase/5,10-methenyltetrahydrofolate cyclohydrolase [Sphingobacterium sp. SGG-5]|uniref:bifunctional 5,10-methylenetetrahydrofolate dehydrogenase/5,10-methenyltetrahydrofolate cyclohydrolase n=1 Tax=Sphingobacterium sp. SGG-5 TaxID=2710881 RepID=UPI0013EDD585|nr:bifunctional 5,10-methylenetetrahydrofolate dehydrogenase/5,10-methenyltetrahydrofolate cyclohydrolase [Sphingobacterium sp. SGG-5]NGM62063.1 bifunctional 5,10-methylenetetrahydrofolate dehydrogenase/5,10-methenyltetrahydrofolate cyclohydrolase [Sphingobacterium sp. SGG-5]